MIAKFLVHDHPSRPAPGKMSAMIQVARGRTKLTVSLMVESVGSVVQSGTSHLEPEKALSPRPDRDAIGRSRDVGLMSKVGKVDVKVF
jgi:hypothetical protein